MRHRSANVLAAIATLGIGTSAWPDTLISEPFDGTGLDPVWTVSFAGNTAGWTAAVAGGLLNVSDIVPISIPTACDAPGAPWSEVHVDRAFAPAGDFLCTASVLWDSGGSIRAVQWVLVDVLDCHGAILGEIGFVDAWGATTGCRYATLGGQSFNSGAGSLPAAGSGTLELARTGTTWTASVNGTPLLTKQVAGVPSTLRLSFAYFASHLCAGGDTIFGNEHVDFVTVTGAAGTQTHADLTGEGRVDGADLGVLLGAWGSADCQADLDHSGTVDGADLGTLLGSWSV